MSFTYQPNASATVSVSSLKTFTANGTVVVPIFRVTGVVRVIQFWGIVTTAIGTNHTTGFIRLNDGTATAVLSASGGGKITLSNYAVGSIFEKTDLANASLTGINASATGFLEPSGGAGQQISSPFDLVAKTTGTTNLEYVYTTTNSSGGAVEFFVIYQPFTVSGVVGTVTAV